MVSDPTEVEPALFVPDGDNLRPTSFAIGPWRPDALHGAAVAALFGAILDRDDRTVARVTVDITGTVPCKPLTLGVSPLEGGRRVQRQAATLSADERIVARATALYVAKSDLELPTSASETPPSPPAELALLPENRTGWVGFESRAMELHTIGDANRSMLGWFGLRTPVLVDRPLTGLPRVLAAADYTSGVMSRRLSMKQWTFASLDLTVNLTRPPEGEWVGVRADRAVVGDDGSAVSGSTLFDRRGDIGLCTESHFVQALPQRPDS
ncbi:MAG TPA: thioesterase family protein [Acidimicrobiales bacterium]|nr:thioesterase family protein [Acidimicrobiales bacterium]